MIQPQPYTNIQSTYTFEILNNSNVKKYQTTSDQFSGYIWWEIIIWIFQFECLSSVFNVDIWYLIEFDILQMILAKLNSSIRIWILNLCSIIFLQNNNF